MKLVVLGATGSIGEQTLDVAQRLDLEVAVVAARRGSDSLFAKAGAFPDAEIVVADPTQIERDRFAETFGSRVSFGAEAIIDAASQPASTVVNGIVGAAGLPASVAALDANNRLALANKESLVAGGPVVLDALSKGSGEIIPVDSEHSALFQCLVGESTDSIRKLVVTASGGPFFGQTRSQLHMVTADQALAHPTWTMGPRVTIDSATLVNKGLEVIEAHFLFGIDYDRIEVVVHPQSIVHSLVEFVDGSLKAQIGDPDMRVPIQYALTYPERHTGALEEFSLAGRDLIFREPDRDVFRALDLAFAAGRTGGNAPAVFNAADEIAVQSFLDGKIGFLRIPEIVEQVLSTVVYTEIASVDEVFATDAEARSVAAELVSNAC